MRIDFRARVRPPSPGFVGPLAAALVLAASAAPAEPQDPGSQRSVLHGVYTEAQADRGKETFEAECSTCHFHDEFQGTIWTARWSGRSAGDALEHIRATMPVDRPASLTRQQYTDLIAYIFRLNEYPVGDDDLSPEPEELGRILIERPEGPRR